MNTTKTTTITVDDIKRASGTAAGAVCPECGRFADRWTVKAISAHLALHAADTTTAPTNDWKCSGHIRVAADGTKTYREKNRQTGEVRWTAGAADDVHQPTTKTYDIVKNTRDFEKEDRRTGRIRTGMVTTWDVVDTTTCRLVSECYTLREAKAVLQQLTTKGGR